MRRISPGLPQPLHDIEATRRIESAALAALPPHTLMQRAGTAVARLALALAPHARTVWIACGPGNNGGDGLEAAVALRQRGLRVVVTRIGDAARRPADAQASLARAQSISIEFADEPPARFDLAIDALLGIGRQRPLDGMLAAWARHMNGAGAPVLAIDTPSGLDADRGSLIGGTAAPAVRATHTLSLLTLKPGLFTAEGRDHAGDIWLDELGLPPDDGSACAWLSGAPRAARQVHASHKGSHGDVGVIGGAAGMSGAAVLAARAALHAGAGRVFLALLDAADIAIPPDPECMLRAPDQLDLERSSIACGCGGGTAIAQVLPAVLAAARRLVLDADALNAVAAEPSFQEALARRGRDARATVLTPHPLEAARLLGCSTSEIQADRLLAAGTLARRYGCVVVLKGSGTVIAQPSGLACINPTGNARLATAGTGDVLAGLIAARLAAPSATVFEAACAAVYEHGRLADEWPAGEALTASRLAARLQR
ncbi:MAG: NAD(P)H-hydrate dehydratase [Burkholderiales bacterium]|nr:NAD(P)H-hydrate dehydratase [Burkholderiales bacterium]